MNTTAEEKFRNIGPVSLGWLIDAGIESLGDLERVGSVDAYCRVKAMGRNVSLNLLYALEGALMDIDWRELPPDVKAELRRAAGRIK